MKAYIFITPNLHIISGANIYIYNKMKFLQSKGYNVYVFSVGEGGNILISGLKKYQKYQSPYFRFYPNSFPRKKIDAFIDKVSLEINAQKCSEIIVESTHIICALWGELISTKLFGKHFAFLLTEDFSYSEHIKEFLRFKLARQELAGISIESVMKMLNDKSIKYNETMRIAAICTNTIDECEDNITPRLNHVADITIGSIGRLEKAYVLPLMQQLKIVFLDNVSINYNLILVGGSKDQSRYRMIKDIFVGCKNVNLVFTGYIYPIPKSFVDRCDLFISASGSAGATYNHNKATIRINPITADIVGIIGLTYMPGDFSNFSSKYPLSDLGKLIKTLLENRNAIKYNNSVANGTYKVRMEKEFQRQLDFKNLERDNSYFDTYTIKEDRDYYKHFRLFGKFVNVEVLYKIAKNARKLLK